MKKTLIYYKPENIDIAIELRNNYFSHGYEEVDIISDNEHDDIEYARKMQYDEAIFIEDSNTVVIHDIKTWHMERLPVSEVYYND